MRRLGKLAQARGISVQDMITSILTDVAQTADAEEAGPPERPEPHFLADDKATDIIRGVRKREKGEP